MRILRNFWQKLKEFIRILRIFLAKIEGIYKNIVNFLEKIDKNIEKFLAKIEEFIRILKEI